jgi:hypothetical protein
LVVSYPNWFSETCKHILEQFDLAQTQTDVLFAKIDGFDNQDLVAKFGI